MRRKKKRKRAGSSPAECFRIASTPPYSAGTGIEQRGPRLWWSRYRREHQAKARECHVQRRARQAPPVPDLVPEAIRLPGLPTLTDVQWERLRPLLPAQKPRTGRPATDHRLIVEGMLWVVRTGSCLSRVARTLWTLVHGGQSLSTLVQGRHLDTNLARLTGIRGSHFLVGLNL